MFVGAYMLCNFINNNFVVTTTATFVPQYPVKRETLFIERETDDNNSIDVTKFFPCVDDTLLAFDNKFYDSHVDLNYLLSEDFHLYLYHFQ